MNPDYDRIARALAAADTVAMEGFCDRHIGEAADNLIAIFSADPFFKERRFLSIVYGEIK